MEQLTNKLINTSNDIQSEQGIVTPHYIAGFVIFISVRYRYHTSYCYMKIQPNNNTWAMDSLRKASS